MTSHSFFSTGAEIPCTSDTLSITGSGAEFLACDYVLDALTKSAAKNLLQASLRRREFRQSSEKNNAFSDKPC